MLLATADAYRTARSIRFRKNGPTYLQRSFLAAGDFTKWTYSVFLKIGDLVSDNLAILSAGPDANNLGSIRISANRFEAFLYAGGAIVWRVASTALFRDGTQHLHMVVHYDSLQAAAVDRVKLTINNVAIPLSAVEAFGNSGGGMYINTATQHMIGCTVNYATTCFDGVKSNIRFVDGQIVPASAFAMSDPATGMWVPKKYTGTFGAQGSLLDFEDISAATASSLGRDTSGNNNNWTPVNFSVVPTDKYFCGSLDVPTTYADGGTGRGNYCTLNPADKGSSVSLYEGALTTTPNSSAWSNIRGTYWMTTGKWYFEAMFGVAGMTSMFGVCDVAMSRETYAGQVAGGWSIHAANGFFYSNGSSIDSGTGAWAAGDVVRIAVDMDAKKIWFGRNGVWLGASADPAAGSGPAYSNLTAEVAACVSVNNSVIGATYVNFGQRPFAFSPPTGFKALNSANLPDSTIVNSKKYYNAVLYNGSGATPQNVTGIGFQPSMVWGKSRSAVTNNNIYDDERGAGALLITNASSAELTGGELSTFTSDGFSLGANVYQLNQQGSAMIARCWKRGVVAGFDMVRYTGSAAARSIAHGLGVVPALKIVKQRTSRDWFVNHKGHPPTVYQLLDGSDAATTNATVFSGGDTSSVFNIGASGAVNTAGENYIAYLWAEIPGFSRFGSYGGTGSADGPFVNCGFRPAFIMIKRLDGATNWITYDALRTPLNPVLAMLFADAADAETTANAGYPIDILANGFKIRGIGGAENAAGGTYIFMAFAEAPFKYARAR